MLYRIFRFTIQKITPLLFLFVLKIQAQIGYIQWIKPIGGYNVDYAKSMVLDSTDNIYIVGSFGDSMYVDLPSGRMNLKSHQSTDIFIAKINPLGNFIWIKAIGGIAEDVAKSIAMDSKGNLIITGGFYDMVDFDPGKDTFYLTSAGSTDIFILKMDQNGKFIWAKNIGSSGYDIGEFISCDSVGDMVISGNFAYTVDFDPGIGMHTLSAGLNGIFTLKLDNNGNYQWVKPLGPNAGYGNPLKMDKWGNTYLAGNNNNGIVYKFGPDGDTIWMKNAMNMDGRSIAFDQYNNFILSGYTVDKADADPGPDSFLLYPNSPFLLKWDTSGKFIHAKYFGPYWDRSYSVASDPQDNIYVSSGYFSGTNIKIFKFDSSIKQYSTEYIGGNGNRFASSMEVDKSGNLLVLLTFSNSCYFYDSAIGNDTSTSSGFDDILLVKYGPDKPANSKTLQKFQTTLFPNPFSETLNVSTTSPIQTIEIFNPTGQLIKRMAYRQQLSATLNLTELASGLYFMKIRDVNGLSSTFKIQKNN